MKTIAVSEKTHTRLKKHFKEYGDTFDLVMNRIMDEVEK